MAVAACTKHLYGSFWMLSCMAACKSGMQQQESMPASAEIHMAEL